MASATAAAAGTGRRSVDGSSIGGFLIFDGAGVAGCGNVRAVCGQGVDGCAVRYVYACSVSGLFHCDGADFSCRLRLDAGIRRFNADVFYCAGNGQSSVFSPFLNDYVFNRRAFAHGDFSIGCGNDNIVRCGIIQGNAAVCSPLSNDDISGFYAFDNNIFGCSDHDGAGSVYICRCVSAACIDVRRNGVVEHNNYRTSGYVSQRINGSVWITVYNASCAHGVQIRQRPAGNVCAVSKGGSACCHGLDLQSSCQHNDGLLSGNRIVAAYGSVSIAAHNISRYAFENGALVPLAVQIGKLVGRGGLITKGFRQNLGQLASCHGIIQIRISVFITGQYAVFSPLVEGALRPVF